MTIQLDVFRETFWTPFEQYRERIGQSFTVLGHDVATERELEAATGDGPQVMYKIRFDDGFETCAWPEEVCIEVTA